VEKLNANITGMSDHPKEVLFSAESACLQPAVGAVASLMNKPNRLPSGVPSELGLEPDRLERLHRGISLFVERGLHAGIAILLARDGNIVDTFEAGYRDLELNVPMTRDTIVRIYSMTKIVVSVAALQLLEEGKLGLLDPVTDYLPAFRDASVFAGGTAKNPELVFPARPMTIQHLFTHTSGLLYEAPGQPIGEFYERLYEGETNTLEQLVNAVARLPLSSHPGTRFAYGFSTDVLARVIEVVSGERLDLFLRERLLGPLDMVDTGYSVDGSQMERLAKVYEHGSDGVLRPVISLRGESTYGKRDFPGGSAGLFSTLDDYARFAQMLCNRGELNGVRIIGRKTWELMVANHLTIASVPFIDLGVGHGFGLGVAVRIDNGAAATLGTINSFGWSGMATTCCRIDPKERFVSLCFAQHLPFDQHGLIQRFTNLSYQALL
jgi:CubicO group peptidase (beta-lactamase class C family)